MLTMPILLLFSIALLWGSQFVLMQLASPSLSPMELAFSRALLGVVCLSLALACLPKLPSRVPWRHYHLLGLLEVSLPFALLAYAQQHLAASLSSVVMGLIPILTLILAPWLGLKEFRGPASLIPIGLGFSALAWLFWPELTQGLNLTLISLICTVLAAACFALGALLIRRLALDGPILAARNILLCGGLQLACLLPLSVRSLPEFTSQSLTATLVLGILSTGLVYVLFTSLIKRSGASFAAFSNYLVPIFGLLLAVWLLQEPAGMRLYVALSLVLLAVALDQGLRYQQQRRQKTNAAQR